MEPNVCYLLVWTRAYRPFAVTGVHADIAMRHRTDDFGRHTLHHSTGVEDFETLVYSVNNPLTGDLWYVDSKSGGLLGRDLQEIDDDDLSTFYLMRYADNPNGLVNQRRSMLERGRRAIVYEPEDFWRLLIRPKTQENSNA